jgi:PAX-interacting protein 1
MAYAYAQPGVVMAHPGQPQMQFQSAAQARQYQQQQQAQILHQQQLQQHHEQQQQQQQMQMQMQYQQQHPSHQMPQGNVVMVNGYPRPANPTVQHGHGHPSQEYAVPFSTTQYAEHQPVAGPSHPAGQQVHGHQQVQMAVPAGMTLQRTSQGRMIVVPLPVPHPSHPEGAAPNGYAHPSQPQPQSLSARPGLQSTPQSQLHTPSQPQSQHSGYTATPRTQPTPGLIPGTVARVPTSAADVLGSALSQGPLEHPTTGVGGTNPGPSGHPDEIVMIDGQAYSARTVRERQAVHRHNMMVHQQQQQQQQQQRQMEQEQLELERQHEMRARQQELSDAEEQAEAEMQMQLHLQRQAQAQAQAQAHAQATARLQQEQLIQDRDRDRALQMQQQQRQKLQQMQLEQRQQEQQQQQAQQRQQKLGQVPNGVYGTQQQSPARVQPGQAGPYHTLRGHGQMQESPVVPIPVQSEAQIQQMREIQAQQMREIQIRQQSNSTPSEQHAIQTRAGQISTAEAMAMRDREREMRSAMQGPTDTPVQSRYASGQRMIPGSAMSTPAGPGPGSEMASTALSTHSQPTSQAGSAVRLAQMQLQAGLGLGMPAKRETVDASSAVGYPPPRAISMVMHGEEKPAGVTSPNFETEPREFRVPTARLVSQSPMAPGRPGVVGTHPGDREPSHVPVSRQLIVSMKSCQSKLIIREIA